MHGSGTIILKQDVPKAPPVLLTGVWYAPDAALDYFLLWHLPLKVFHAK